MATAPAANILNGMDSVMQRHAITVREGPGPTLLFAHGLGTDQTVWDRLLPHLGPHRIVTFDHAGCGRAVATSTTTHGSLEDHARDLVAVADASCGAKPVLVAHSMSSTLAVLAVATMGARFEQIIMIAPSPCWLDDPPYRGGYGPADIDGFLQLMDQNFIGWAAAISGRAGGTADGSAYLDASLRRGDPSTVARLARLVFHSDVRALLPDVAVPVTIIDAESDGLVPRTAVDYMVAQLPDATLSRLPLVGHLPHLTAPAEVARAIEAAVGRAHGEGASRGTAC